MKIKQGDKVKVITGSYKGSVGEVKKVLRKSEKVVVEGVNMAKKHLKPTQMNPEGGIMEMEAPIHVSNVMIVDPKTNQASRIGYKIEKDKKVRVLKKTGATLKEKN